MKRIMVALAVVAALGGVLAAVFANGSEAAPADAVQRTFVSTSGNDANPCAPTAPCRSFQAALANTLAGGEVVALDSGGYGPFTIDKAVSVVGAPGVHAALSVFSGDGITIDAGSSDRVVLRNLYLSGLGGQNGVVFAAGGSLHVESLTATGFTSRGLQATAANATLVVRDSVFRHNLNGVFVNGTLRVEIEGSRADRNSGAGFALGGGARGSIAGSSATRNNGDGFQFSSGAVASLSDSVADGNAADGILAGGAGTQVTVSGVTTSNNFGSGLFVFSGTPVARIGGSTVTGNTFGLAQSSGTLESFGDNLVRGNSTNTSGTVTPVSTT